MASLMDALKKKTSFVKQDFSKDDEWTISKDKSGNGAAVIRFIPSKDGELFQEVKSHGYKNPQSNKWFIENCPKTMDWDNLCPACEHAQALLGGRDYKSLTKDEQAKIKPFFTNTSYWSTILVEKDDANPENEGKIFKFRYGKKILEKILGRAGDDPLDDAIKGVNVFDPKDGASFKLVVKRVEGFPNYDTSSFKAPEALLGGNQKKIDALVQTGQEIGYMRTDKNFKEYSDLKKRFYSILGKEIPAQEEEVLDKPVTEESYDKPEVPDVSFDSGSDDEDLDYFKELSSSNV
jgi:hypothetical protein